MELLQLTHKKFRDGIRVKVVRVESNTTMWVRIESKPRISEMLTLVMNAHPMAFWPTSQDLKPGRLAAVQVDFQGARLWARGILLQETATGYTILLIDFGVKIHRHVTSIRLLPQKFTKIAPWARKLRLLGVRDQVHQTPIHRAIQISILDRSGILMNVDPSPGDAMTARLLLHWKLEEPPEDIAEYCLNLGYIDVE